MPDNTAEELANQATNAYQHKKYLQAAELFDIAATRYESESNPLMAGEMKNNRSVALLQANDAAGALHAAQNTDTLFAEMGDTTRQAMALGNQAAALEALGKFQESLEKYQQSSELLKGSGNQEMHSLVLKRISALQIRTGKPLESMASMEAALNSSKPTSMKEKLLKKLLSIPFKKG